MIPALKNPIRRNMPLAAFTTWKVGGPADYLAEPTEDEAPGLVILTRNSLCRLERKQDHISAGAGVSSSFAANEGSTGFGFMIGIPGTVGGAIALNAELANFRPREMTAVVESFDLVDLEGVVSRHIMADIHAGYRQTDLLKGDRMVLRARFKLNAAWTRLRRGFGNRRRRKMPS